MKRSSVVRFAVTVLFIALLATPLIYKRVLARRQADSLAKTQAQAMAEYGFLLTESAKASGISFNHKAPQLDKKTRSHHGTGCFHGCGRISSGFRS